MKRLVVTADDFGASLEVNEAVERAHRDGILTAASLMVGGAAVNDAVERAKRLPSLGVGLHVVLVDGRPVLPSDRVPALVDSEGKFRTDMVRAAMRIFASPAARRQLAAEVEAQFDAFAATGLPLDHVNAHKHFHLHPTIAATLVKVGKAHGMRTVRAPVEPRAVLRAVESDSVRSGVEGIWAQQVQRLMRRASLTTPDQVFGLAWSGAMTTSRIQGLLKHLPDGLSEIYAHPATGPYAGSAPGYRYAEELAALTDSLAKQAVARNAIVLGRFTDFIEGERS
ncbi:hopanoid biosynthesis associated protein HpnK [Novosphingobium sp. PhB165]|uniref:hopanoid biosynthesis-associated protein HpnK n=1 Tax=Novosphingobium sp. PhB165 TaxID=2485105 RepID=UPI001050F724|nr:hopanoid biosynthesis-associated protein HpnK [Novosphingobium sp. PhB165]TCM16051.1 hopanoid biosynthesis associated protein HpnK [Novosphingobium sp. PhB165]